MTKTLEPWEIYEAANWQLVHESEKSAYGRTVCVKSAKWACDVCKQENDVLEIDTSDGEYLSFTCCLSCFQNLINKAKK